MPFKIKIHDKVPENCVGCGADPTEVNFVRPYNANYLLVKSIIYTCTGSLIMVYSALGSRTSTMDRIEWDSICPMMADRVLEKTQNYLTLDLDLDL